ncbi:BICD family-like cargo adapter 1 isoform X2 [Octopus bimaculoides]|uniref:BICD family-like cargo adapter 1 isoform X2 n=1 Tax=Octopus bimaculoides TaxID=37653 RepID=UPI0022E26CB1|nr:BICD family-like cargo adapter 1 isoform X2 [Octopus bimaculoides]
METSPLSVLYEVPEHLEKADLVPAVSKQTVELESSTSKGKVKTNELKFKNDQEEFEANNSSENSEFTDSWELTESVSPSEGSRQQRSSGSSLFSNSSETSQTGSPEMPKKYDKPVHVVSKCEEIFCLICENNLKICGSSYTNIFKGQKRGSTTLPERISSFIGAAEDLKLCDVGSSYMCAQCQRNLQKAELLEKQVNQIRDTFTNSFSNLSRNSRMKKRRITLNNQQQSSVEVKQLQIRIKELEQERHALRLRLESLEAEYENTVKELQDDVNQLRQDLQGQQQQLTAGDKDKVNIIRELTHQNERLSDQVQHAAETEGQLVSEIEGLRSQVSLRMSMPDQLDQLDALHAKINELTEKKCEIERKIHLLTEERDSYACSLEESQERILMLEKQKLEQELHIRNQGREIYELQEVNHQLQAQIDNLSQRTSYGNTGPPSQTLFNELSGLSVDSDKEPAVLSVQSEALTSLTPQSMMMMDMTFEDDIECDDECSPIPLANSTMSTHFNQIGTHCNLSEEFLNEIVEVYNLLCKLCTKLRTQNQAKAISDGSDVDCVGPVKETCNSINDIKSGQLRSLLRELQQLIHNQIYSAKHKDGSKAADGESRNADEVRKVTLMAEQIHDLHVELNGVRTHVSGLHADLQLRDQQLQQKATEVSERNTKIDSQQEELFKLRAYCDSLEDKALGDLSRDEVLEQARRDRNEAMEMKVQMEKELYQAKSEIMSLNNQLMAAIHQKVMVSQQRDQWQNDMEDLIDIQMRKRLIQETRNELAEERIKESKVKRTSSFFSRVKH